MKHKSANSEDLPWKMIRETWILNYQATDQIVPIFYKRWTYLTQSKLMIVCVSKFCEFLLKNNKEHEKDVFSQFCPLPRWYIQTDVTLYSHIISTNIFHSVGQKSTVLHIFLLEIDMYYLNMKLYYSSWNWLFHKYRIWFIILLFD